MYLKKTKKSNRLYHIIQRQLETTLMLKTYIFVLYRWHLCICTVSL